MWGTWFGGSGAQKRKDAPKKAILDLRQQLDMLQKREKHLENQMAEQEKIAKMNVSTNKTAARTALKRKKAHEHSLEQTSAQISMLENQIYSIESANINQETLLAMKNASKAMKDIHGNLTIDKVDDIMYVVTPISPTLPEVNLHFEKPLLTKSCVLLYREGLGEQRALAEEIGNAIANGPQAGEPIDESELEDEISRLEQENLDEKMTNTGMTVPQLPTGLHGELPGRAATKPMHEDEDEEEELRKLQAEMAM
ncbi:ESCRT-III subunit protein snf7 [Xylographa opegraphella]|nr:ESCRT-III subunit protein snf7 [Xylographa opegraphella]